MLVDGAQWALWEPVFTTVDHDNNLIYELFIELCRNQVSLVAYYLPHSRNVPGAAITRSGLVGILHFDFKTAVANDVVTRVNGFAVFFDILVPKLRIRVTWRRLSCCSGSFCSLSSSPGRCEMGDKRYWASSMFVCERQGINLKDPRQRKKKRIVTLMWTWGFPTFLSNNANYIYRDYNHLSWMFRGDEGLDRCWW